MSHFEQVTEAPTHFILMNYYPVPESDLSSRVYGSRVSPEVIAATHAGILCACTPDGTFADFTNLVCIDLSQLLDPIEQFLERSIAADQIHSGQYMPINPANMRLIQAYWREVSNGALVADGTHLTLEAKNYLSQYVYQHIKSLEK